MIGPIINEGMKSLITFGKASIINGKNKKNKSFFMAQMTIIIENKNIDKKPNTLKPGYWNSDELNDKKMHRMLNIYIIIKNKSVKENKILLYIIFYQRFYF